MFTFCYHHFICTLWWFRFSSGGSISWQKCNNGGARGSADGGDDHVNDGTDGTVGGTVAGGDESVGMSAMVVSGLLEDFL